MAQRFVDQLRVGLLKALRSDPLLTILGEDVVDPYGGAFKVTRGLSTEFPDRVLSTPISEAAITGLGVGLALTGRPTIVEIMFGDFVTLAADQLVNFAAKLGGIYGNQNNPPLIIRAPMGGGRGYGPTHSQSIEKMFFGIPGLNVVAPSIGHDPGQLIQQLLASDRMPALFVESKLLYPSSVPEGLAVSFIESDGSLPTCLVENFDVGEPDVIVIAYGGASLATSLAMSALALDEIRVRGIFPAQVSPAPDSAQLSSWIPNEKPVVLAEDGPATFGWTTEVSWSLIATNTVRKSTDISIVTGALAHIPAASVKEVEVVLTPEKVEASILSALGLEG